MTSLATLAGDFLLLLGVEDFDPSSGVEHLRDEVLEPRGGDGGEAGVGPGLDDVDLQLAEVDFGYFAFRDSYCGGR